MNIFTIKCKFQSLNIIKNKENGVQECQLYQGTMALAVQNEIFSVYPTGQSQN